MNGKVKFNVNLFNNLNINIEKIEFFKISLIDSELIGYIYNFTILA